MWTEGLGYRSYSIAIPDGRYTDYQGNYCRSAFELYPTTYSINWQPRLARSTSVICSMCAASRSWWLNGNNGHVVEVAGQYILTAQKGETWLALGATVPFKRLSCGYVGQSDGWTDLADNFQMDWEFDNAIDGNISLTGELDLASTKEFTLGLAFGNSLHNAISTLLPIAQYSVFPAAGNLLYPVATLAYARFDR